MSITNPNFQSRWGFHPCSYDVFLKLKRLHKWYWQTVYDFHRWHRWRRKEKQNQAGSEPKFCPVFVENRVWYKPVQTRGVAGFKVYPMTLVDYDVVRLYRAARMPEPQPVVLLDDATLRKIESLYAAVLAYYAV